MDVVMAPAAEPPRTSPTTTTTTSSKLSAYELYRQKNTQRATVASTRSTSPSGIASLSTTTTTATSTTEVSKVSSYERYRQHRQKQLQAAAKATPGAKALVFPGGIQPNNATTIETASKSTIPATPDRPKSMSPRIVSPRTEKRMNLAKGGANELHAALAILQSKKERASPRDLRKTRLSHSAAADTKAPGAPPPVVERKTYPSDALRSAAAAKALPPRSSSTASAASAPPTEQVPRPTGWSTMSHRRSVSSPAEPASFLSRNSKVGEYLATRRQDDNALLAPPEQVTRESTVSTSLSSMLTSDEETRGSADDSSLSSVEDDATPANENVSWSVRVCIVSAVDFPINVVPNLPLSPVLRVALVPLPEPNPRGDGGAEELSDKDRLKRSIDTSGVASVKQARIRCTSSKVTSKRDNGSVEFHEEMRWDYVEKPERVALAVELSARAVMTPANIRESPYSQTVQPIQFPTSTGSIGRATDSGIGSIFRPTRQRKEMETANAAAAVAKHLVEEARKSGDEEDDDTAAHSDSASLSTAGMRANNNQSEMDVKLRTRKKRNKTRMTDDIRLGSQVIALSELPLRKTMEGNETARIEQWFQLETPHSFSSSNQDPNAKTPSKRNPSILLEISFSSQKALDDSEDDMDDAVEKPGLELKASFSRRASMKIRNQLKKEKKPVEVVPKEEEPVLEPGILDYVCIVGARDIGDQKTDDGSSGWVNSTPECALLEQFPPSPDFYANTGRNALLPDKVEWFCFPEGCKLWRGTTPPNSEELNLKRFSASSPANIATTIASFDACLGCTTSFSWFVLASNSDEYGSDNVKTYGACIRFFVPAPIGIDQTQDDFGQVGPGNQGSNTLAQKRLWVPMGILVTSSMPIVGALEVILLRLCEAMSTPGRPFGNLRQPSVQEIYEDVLNLVLNFHRPIPGLVQCSVPFLAGEPLQISLGPTSGLPQLPHGSAVTSVCRLLGAEGIVFLLAAMLTESKILLHSDDTANVSLVAEVATALLYPFTWSLPYIPILPFAMMEFIEAPMPYLVGIPSCNFNLLDHSALEDVVVIDLDKDVSDGGYFDDTLNGFKSKIPTPLPSSTAGNISKAVYRLLQADPNSESSTLMPDTNGRIFPRMQGETLVERELRIAVAMEICGLVRGYQDCLVYASSSQPMFNVDKFLQSAPILFEEQRGTSGSTTPRQILSPRSRRFMSVFVNCQHFHQFLESEQQVGKRFFHHIMRELDAFGAKKDLIAVKRVLSLDAQKTIDLLRGTLKRIEDRITTFSVEKANRDTFDFSSIEKAFVGDFPFKILAPIEIMKGKEGSSAANSGGVHRIPLEYLVELEKNPWRFLELFCVDSAIIEGYLGCARQVKISDAIGERQYRNWKSANERIEGDDFPDEMPSGTTAVDLGSLLAYNSDETSVTTDTTASEDSPSVDAKRRVADAKDRDVLRRCLERANLSNPSGKQNFNDSVDDLISGAEIALRNPSSRRFLLSVLSKLSQVQRDSASDTPKTRRRSAANGPSKLDVHPFETLVRLGCAMLDACIEDRDYSSAYSLLKLTAGLYCHYGEGETMSIVYMAQKMGHHPIYADLGVWEKAKEVHLAANRKDPNKAASDDEADGNDDEYEAAVATLYEMLGYGIPAEELARFASRVSENSGWFQSERGQSLLLLARRICMRRDQGEATSSSKTSDLEMMSPSGGKNAPQVSSLGSRGDHDETAATGWVELGWVHPAAQSSRRMGADKFKRPGAPSTQYPPENLRTGSGSGTETSYMKRSAITTMAYLGSSVVATGGLDGGVFLARKVRSLAAEARSQAGIDPCDVRGVHLDWGSSGSRYAVGSSAASLDGEYGVGAVSCLAATRAANQSYQSIMLSQKSPKKDTVDVPDDEDIVASMDGARVVAGTTCGDLRVWSVKDVLSAVFYANSGGDFGTVADTRTLRGEGTSSTFLSKRKGGTDFAAGSSLTRLKFSLRGRALSGHRGGVSCIDVPSYVYRPDSIISGGADGLIKLWSLRTSASGRRNELDQGSMLAAASKGSTETMTSKAKSSRSGDALSILSGHGGRVLCIKTAWHGDRLLSGGADRTVRVWDLAGSSGKCLHSLSGHFGWVTNVQYWGPNTIISASTDRSIALWDARVRNSPLFALRHHNAPISSVLVGTRTDPIMVSAASDGTIAAWDFRHLSDAETGSNKLCKVVRSAAAKLYLHDFTSRRKVCGPVLLSRGPNADKRSVLCVGRDAVIRQWDIRTGNVMSEHATGHCDTISTFSSFQGESLVDTQLETTGTSAGIGGTITTSWDGTVRMRSQIG